jgi:hypothetical protein
MLTTTCGGKEMEESRRRSQKAFICLQVIAVGGTLIFTIGQSIAQESAPSDVYVASQRIYVQKLAEDVKAKHPSSFI